ncbi:Cof-type HAD-IIB family hydrolase [Liquorilactobacillus uvarum]|uniref:Cof-type HAD-IIB family hydrolase n=1 Tax=Liquorilactobacillus uvarum TaxID=303240 RepID=UPI002889105B|nr:Cof-type HAD-IIB family hydrolase [Liquorilactobacillus uvarum]
MANSVKLVVSDVDGTILTTRQTITAKLKKTVSLINTQNIPFVLASARSPQGMYPIAKALRIQSNPLVSYNGAFTLKMNEDNIGCQLKSHPMKNDAVRRIVEIVKEQFPHISVNIYAKNTWFIEKNDIWIQLESDITKLKPTTIRFESLYGDEKAEIHKLLLIGKTEKIQELYNYLEKVKFEGIAFYLSKENYLEIVATNVSKETALKELAAYYQIDTKEILAIGDQFNDIPMLRLAGIGIAMGNAPAKVKKVATFVTTSNDNDGVANALINSILEKS